MCVYIGDEEPCSLDEYVKRMKDGVDTIFYLVAQNRKVRARAAQADGSGGVGCWIAG